MICKSHWIVTADERKAMLYECRLQSPGQWQIEQKKHLENRWQDYHEHHRPSALGRGPTANASQHFAANEHEREEEHRRFARDVVPWLADQCRDNGIAHIDVFAAPRFLGVLRVELGALSKQAGLHKAELTRLAASDLATHPAVIAALESRSQSHAHTV